MAFGDFQPFSYPPSFRLRLPGTQSLTISHPGRALEFYVLRRRQECSHKMGGEEWWTSIVHLFPSSPALLSHSTLVTKHKVTDKMMKNFKTVVVGHFTRLEPRHGALQDRAGHILAKLFPGSLWFFCSPSAPSECYM